MMPLLKKYLYKHKNGHGLQEFIIKKKDYGEIVLFDIFYEDLFLFTISHEGKVLLSNWECAKKEPVGMDEKTLDGINTFIIHL